MYECNFLFWPENSKIRVCILQILARLIVPMAGFASVTICAPVLTVSVGPIARIRLVLSTVKMAAFAPCPITNANVGTATMELDVTKSEYYKFKEEEIFKNRCMENWWMTDWCRFCSISQSKFLICDHQVCVPTWNVFDLQFYLIFRFAHTT